MNGAATKNGKFSGKVLKEKKTMMKGKFPIMMCRNLREVFFDRLFSIFPVTKITDKMYV